MVELVHTHPGSEVAPSLWNDPISNHYRGEFSVQDKMASLQIKSILEELTQRGYFKKGVDLRFGLLYTDSSGDLQKAGYVLSKD